MTNKMFGRVGVQGENGQADECHVAIAGDLANYNKRDAYANLVRVFTFEEFQTESGQPLNEWMEKIKPEFEETNDDSVNDSDDDDEDYSEDRGEIALSRLHDEFLPIVQEILRQNPNFYTHGVVEEEVGHIGRAFTLKKYARPNHRTATSHYASYLHNDAWIPWDKDDDTTSTTCSTVKVAMMNVWFVLNDQPPSNSLVFWETAADTTVQSHMLHAKPMERHSTVVCDSAMQWGRFYLFVAGQLNTSKRVLLHGAMEVPSTETTASREATPPPSHVRKSVEMRYTVHLHI